MHFCDKCDNMYYLKIGDEDKNKLIHYCRHCGNEDLMIGNENNCISKIHIKKNGQKLAHIMNEYTKLDPTLPRTSSIKCPNSECLSNQSSEDGVEREIVYIRYDDENVKYVYLCANCDFTWKIDDQK